MTDDVDVWLKNLGFEIMSTFINLLCTHANEQNYLLLRVIYRAVDIQSVFMAEYHLRQRILVGNPLHLIRQYDTNNVNLFKPESGHTSKKEKTYQK